MADNWVNDDVMKKKKDPRYFNRIIRTKPTWSIIFLLSFFFFSPNQIESIVHEKKNASQLIGTHWWHGALIFKMNSFCVQLCARTLFFLFLIQVNYSWVFFFSFSIHFSYLKWFFSQSFYLLLLFFLSLFLSHSLVLLYLPTHW